MKGNPFIRYSAALIVGICLYVLLPDRPQLPFMSLLMGVALLSWGIYQQAGQPIKPIQVASGIGGLLMLMAFGWAITYQKTALNQPDSIVHLTDSLQAYEGVIVSQPEERAKTYRVELAIRRGKWGSQLSPAKWHSLSGRVLVYLDKADLPTPKYGEIWLVSGGPRLIDPPLNPGEFNYKQYLAYRNIYHQQYIRPFGRTILAVEPPRQLTNVAINVNRWADSVITHQVGTRTEYGIVKAMILGVRDDLDTDLYKAYSASGAVHILSVSGLHVAILFNVLTYLLSFLMKRPRGKILIAILQLLILWFYTLVTGFSPPVIRSAAMFSLLIVAKVSGRQQHMANTLGVSAFFILLFDPYALFSAGFQLSYLAVAGIGAWQSPLNQIITFRYKWANKLWELTAVALVAQLITFPLGVFYFHQFPTYFLLANPVVLFMSQLLLQLAMATLAVSWIPYVNEVLGWGLQKIAWILNYAVSQTGQLPGAMWDGLWLSASAIVFVYLVIVCGATLLRTRQAVYLWCACIAAILLAGETTWTDFQQRRQQRLAVHFLPHRTAVSLTSGQHSLLLTDLDSTDTRSYDFYLKNTFGLWGVSSVKSLNTSNVAQPLNEVPVMPAHYQTRDYTLWVWQGRTILLVNKLASRYHWRLPAVVDFLILRRNALQQWHQLDGRVVARHIIFDDSNRTPLTDRLLMEAKAMGIVCYSVRQMGAYVADLN